MELVPRNIIAPAVRPELRLRLSPQMRQSLFILQLPFLDLRRHLENELAANPFLEESRGPDGSVRAAKEKPTDWDDVASWIESGEDFSDSKPRMSDEEIRRMEYLKEASFTRQPSLGEHLEAQVELLDLPDCIADIAREIIGNLNEDGYLACSLPEIAESCAVKIEEVEEALSAVQRLDPPGVGARDLQECLLLQLVNLKGIDGRLCDLAKAIVRDHLDDLKMKRYGKIAKALKASPEEINQAAGQIRKLDPKPGKDFAPMRVLRIIPDVVIRRKGRTYEIDCNTKERPLRINASYRELLKARNVSAAEKKYLREKLNSALGLLRAMGERQKTIQRVAECLVKRQKEFLDKGPSHLKPFTLKETARLLDLHKSTLSRTVANKYVETPHGVFGFKALFDVGPRGGPDPRSGMAIKNRIKELIHAEDKRKPLSDERLVRALKSQEIHVARRTVAKYREALRILPSYLRKAVD